MKKATSTARSQIGSEQSGSIRGLPQPTWIAAQRDLPREMNRAPSLIGTGPFRSIRFRLKRTATAEDYDNRWATLTEHSPISTSPSRWIIATPGLTVAEALPGSKGEILIERSLTSIRQSSSILAWPGLFRDAELRGSANTISNQPSPTSTARLRSI